MKLITDGRTATLDIQGVFNTTQIETLITQLGGIRANMDPPVTYQPPRQDIEGLEISQQSDPYVTVARQRDGRIRFWLRNHGLGWMTFVLDIRHAAGIRDYLITNLPDIKDGTNLVGKKLGDGDAPH